MAALAGNLTSVGNPIQWSLLFARQPEPDLEFTEDDLDEAVPPPAPPMNAPKRSKKGPFLWILLLLLVGGIGIMNIISRHPYNETSSKTTATQAELF